MRQADGNVHREFGEMTAQLNTRRLAVAFDDLNVLKREMFANADSERFGHGLFSRPSRRERFFGFGASQTLAALAFCKYPFEKRLIIKVLANPLDVNQVNAKGWEDGRFEQNEKMKNC